MLGLSTYINSSASDDVISLIQCLSDVDLGAQEPPPWLLMQQCGVPSLSYFPLTMKFSSVVNINFNLMTLDDQYLFRRFCCNKSCRTKQLGSIILTDSSLRSKLINQVINDWHYPSVGFEQLLTLSVFNELTGAVQ